MTSRAWTCLALTWLLAVPALASNVEKSERLVNQHDLSTSIAIGDYYLKQESALAARGYLSKLGQAQNLGRDWNANNAHWKQAEDAIVSALTRETRRDFSSMEWLSEEWSRMNSAEFTEQDLDMLLAHFGTEVGHKQAMILDHTVAFWRSPAAARSSIAGINAASSGT